jgi:hypothetical protein
MGKLNSKQLLKYAFFEYHRLDGAQKKIYKKTFFEHIDQHGCHYTDYAWKSRSFFGSKKVRFRGQC